MQSPQLHVSRGAVTSCRRCRSGYASPAIVGSSLEMVGSRECTPFPVPLLTSPLPASSGQALIATRRSDQHPQLGASLGSGREVDDLCDDPAAVLLLERDVDRFQSSLGVLDRDGPEPAIIQLHHIRDRDDLG
jgi:hypothetical protein